MSRCNQWKIKLDAFLKTKTNHKFAWGINDCLQFVFDVDSIISEKSRFADVRPMLDYETEEQAQELMRMWGMKDVCDIMDARLERKNANFLCCGDIGLIEYRAKNVLSICLGDKFAHPWTTGLGYTHREKIVYGWAL